MLGERRRTSRLKSARLDRRAMERSKQVCGLFLSLAAAPYKDAPSNASRESSSRFRTRGSPVVRHNPFVDLRLSHAFAQTRARVGNLAASPVHCPAFHAVAPSMSRSLLRSNAT